MNNLISVVMATFNGERFIAEQLDSILAQTYSPIEIVCVDDGSSDRTMAILEDYKERHPLGIKVFANPENLGSRKAFERGCALAQGEFIAFSDQDDWWRPDKLELLHAEISERVAFAYSNAEVVDEELGTLHAQRWDNDEKMFHGRNCIEALFFNRVMGCTMLARRSFVLRCIPFPEEVYHHDKYLALMAPALDLEIGFVPRSLIKYRQHGGNLISGVAKPKKEKKPKRKGRSRTREKAAARLRQLGRFDLDSFPNLEIRARLQKEMKMLEAVLDRKPFRALFHYHGLYRKPGGWGYYRTRYARHDLGLILRCLRPGSRD
jgi:glycosyltransferase involved in cell wall biosynthesis